MLFDRLRNWVANPSRRPARRNPTSQLKLTRLEDRAVPAIVGVVGAGAGGGPQVNVYDGSGNLVYAFMAYDPSFTGGVEVALGDINGDNVPDVITGAGPGGGPHVKVFDGAALQLGGAAAQQAVDRPLKDFFAYDKSFLGGVYVAVGDVNRDQAPDIVTGAGAGGGPHVKVFSGTNDSELFSFMAFDINFGGGVRVSAADVGGDNGGTAGGIGSAEIIAAAGPGGGPHVKVFAIGLQNPATLDLISSFFAYDPGFSGGVYVGSGFVTNNRDNQNFAYADIVTGMGSGGTSNVKVWRLDDGSDPNNFLFLAPINFNAFPGFTGGVRVSAGDVDGDGIADLMVGAGPGGGPQVNLYKGKSLANLETYAPPLIDAFFAYDPGFTGGVFVGGTDPKPPTVP